MERSIRIGKDFNVRWSIYKVVDGERQPYELAGKELALRYRMASGIIKDATEWKAKGNVIAWTFRGKDQKSLGSYELILTENAGKNGMVTVDTCKAFKLVAHSCEETEGSGSDIVVQTVTLETEVTFAPIVIEGSGGSYDDTELREMIAEHDVLIEDLQNMKIDKEADDYYPKMAVGTADNLSGVDVVDSEFVFRQSGGGAITDGVARVQSIKGNSVVWNQKSTPEVGTYTDGTIKWAQAASTFAPLQIDNGVIEVAVAKEDNLASVIRTTNRRFPSSHKMLVLYDIYIDASNYTDAKVKMGYFASPTTWLAETQLSSLIGKTTSITSLVTLPSDATTLFVGVYYVLPVGSVVRYSNIRIHDLTQMFGAGNEPTTIEEFYQRIPMGVDLNAYNEGEVISMKATGIKSVGVNAWDGQERELGEITSQGQELNDTSVWRSGYVKVLPNTAYCVTCGNGYKSGMRARFYDANKNFLAALPLVNAGSPFTTPAGAGYLRLTPFVSYVPMDTPICINLSNADINGKYFPYEEVSEDLSLVAKYFPQGMRSAGKAHDEIRYNKTTNKWEKVVRIGEVDMGTLDWIAVDINGSQHFRSEYNQLQAASHLMDQSQNYRCANYVATSPSAYNNKTDKVIAINNGYYGAAALKDYIAVRDSAYTSAASFKAAMQGVILYYELAEPIVTEIEEKDFNLDYKVWNCGTEQMVATEPSAALAADITYGFNAIGKIKELESLVAQLRAKVGI